MLSKLHPSKKVFVFFLATSTRNYKLSKRWFVWVLVELPEDTRCSQLGWILGSSCTYWIKHLNKGSSLCELVCTCLFQPKHLMVKKKLEQSIMYSLRLQAKATTANICRVKYLHKAWIECQLILQFILRCVCFGTD